MHVVEVLSRIYDVEVISVAPADRSKLEDSFAVDLSRARFRQDSDCKIGLALGRRQRWQAHLRLAALCRNYDLVLSNSFEVPEVCYGRRGILINHSTVTQRLRLHDRPPGLLSMLTSQGRSQHDIYKRVYSWTKVVTNSEYTRKSFQNYWQRDSTVIYPPVSIPPSVDDSQRAPLIVGCGFFSALRGEDQQIVCGIKRQDLLIEAFRRLHERGAAGIRLLLIGHHNGDADTEILLEKLRNQAAGLPVEFRINVPHRELVAIFAQARLFWQATGFGKDQDAETGAVETFGMAMVEALGSRCVALAYHAGGAGEILDTVDPGLLWTSLEQLCEKSAALLADEASWANSAGRARARALDFGAARFEAAWFKTVAEVWHG